MSDVINIGKNAKNVTKSSEFEPYSKVAIYVGKDDGGKDIAYVSGNDTGRTLEIENPWGTQKMADEIREKLKSSSFQYQPFTVDGALLDIAAEIGDTIIANGVQSGVFQQSIVFDSLLASDVSAPEDEEVEHEFPYVPSAERKYTRETAYTRTQLTINKDAIIAEAERAVEEEGRINAQLAIHADEISARVKKEDGEVSSFGWKLVSDSWEVFSNGTTVLRATQSGLTIDGKVTAREGYIGNGSQGFEIHDTAIYNGVTSMYDSSHTGVYVGVDGIALGMGAFRVDSGGNLYATSGTFEGNVYAKNIQVGANEGYITGGQVGYQTLGSDNYGLGSVVNGSLAYDSVSNANIQSGSIAYSTCNSDVQGALADAIYASKVFAGTVRANYCQAHIMEADSFALLLPGGSGYAGAGWRSATISGTTINYLGA